MHRNSQGEHLFKVSNENKHSGQIILQKLRTCSSSNRQGKKLLFDFPNFCDSRSNIWISDVFFGSRLRFQFCVLMSSFRELAIWPIHVRAKTKKSSLLGAFI